MKKIYILQIVLVLTIGGCNLNPTPEIIVNNTSELNSAIADAQAGDEIIMKNGEWTDIQIRFYGNGTAEKPILLRAETPGKVIIKGTSNLRLGGQFLIVDGLFFQNGHSPTSSVIQYAISEDTLANHSRVTNCAIIDFNKSQRNISDLWVRFKGRHNQLDHCYLAGKSNRGPTVRVDLEGNKSIKNHHKIVNNHFGPRPPRGGPSAETIQLGNSSTSMTPSHTLVANNLFDRCNGEVEVISSKANFNEFRNNVFYKSEGSLVTRHGNYCLIDGNYFIGDDKSPHVGGIRLIGTGHWVTNNYFFNLRGEIFRAPLAIMNGIHRSAINRYIQVTDVVIAYNSWVNCQSPWQFGVGSNVDQKDVLPASEIRSETPIRTLVANNIIHNTKGDPNPIVRYDSIDGIEFKSNVINNDGVEFRGMEGLEVMDISFKESEENVWIPSSDLSHVDIYDGFEFENIKKDILGNSRTDKNSIGANTNGINEAPNIMDLSKYGPSWRQSKSGVGPGEKHYASTVEELDAAMNLAQNGDTILITADQIEFTKPLKIDRKLTFTSGKNKTKSLLKYLGPAETPAFQMNPGGQLSLSNLKLQGTGENYAFASLKAEMSSLYNLHVNDSEISDFYYVLKAYKYSFSEYIQFTSSTIENCKNGLELSGEDDDRGEYNAENIFITNCLFNRINENVIDYYRGGYDESTVGGNLVVKNSRFTQCGSQEKNGVLINTYGIINVELSNNTFKNNPVELIARLWGAKNNFEYDNTINNSGKIITEQNLPLKLMY